MVSHQHQCIFVEVPKTGSTSIRSIVGSPPRAHLDLWQIKSLLEADWTDRQGLPNRAIRAAYQSLPQGMRHRLGSRQFERYFKFGFVRNPWDRVTSLYFRKEGMRLAGTMSFEEFVAWIQLASSTCLLPSPHRYQLDWFIDPHGQVLADFIGKFENLEADWAFVAGKLGLASSLPHANGNPGRRHYTEYFTTKTRDIVARKFRVDVEHFEYEFGK